MATFNLFFRILFTYAFFAVPNLLMAEPLNAQELKARKFSIDEQPLSQALVLFAMQADAIVLGLPEALAEQRCQAVHGHYSPREALERLTAKNPLYIQQMSAQGFIVHENQPQQQPPPLIQKNTTPPNNTIEEVFVLGHALLLRPSPIEQATTTFESDDIERFQLKDLQTLAQDVPSFTPVSSGEGIAELSLRGIVSFGTIEETTAPVTLHYNGAYASQGELETIAFFDLDNISVQNGPRIAGLGRTSVAGNININSQPVLLDNTTGYLTYTAGNYQQRDFEGALNLSLSSRIALRLAGLKQRRDGYTQAWQHYPTDTLDNTVQLHYEPLNTPIERDQFLPSHQIKQKAQDDNDRQAYRAALIFQAFDNTAITVSTEEHENNSGPQTFLDPYLVNTQGRGAVIDSPAQSQSRFRLHQVRATAQTRPIGWQYLYSHSTYSNDMILDVDIGLKNSFNEFRIEDYLQQKHSHHLEVYSTQNNNKFQWLVGARQEKSEGASHNTSDSYTHASNAPNDTSTANSFSLLSSDKNSLYQDLYFWVSQQWHSQHKTTIEWRTSKNQLFASKGRIGGCAQNQYGPTPQSLYYSPIDYHQRFLDLNNTDAQVANNTHGCWAFTFDGTQVSSRSNPYRLSWQYQPRADWTLTSHYARGYRPESDRVLSTEYQSSDNLEIDITTTPEHKKYQIKAVLFHSRHKNMQIPWNNDQDEIEAINQGIEWQFRSVPWENGRLTFNTNYLHSRIESYEKFESVFPQSTSWNPPVNSNAGTTEGLVHLSGNQLPHAPKWQWLLHYQHQWQLLRYQTYFNFKIRRSAAYYLDVFNRKNITVIQSNNTALVLNSLSQQASTTTLDFNWQLNHQQLPLEITLNIKNITDQKIRTNIREGHYGPDGFISSYAPPRTYALTTKIFF